MNAKRFRDRQQAGEELSQKLLQFLNAKRTIVLGLPRGGAPVAYEVARRLNLPMDVLIVRKLGVPGYEELAFGAIASGGAMLLNKRIVRDLKISDETVNAVRAREQSELNRREEAYRNSAPFPELGGLNVILIDDGIATGATMRAAIDAARLHGAKAVIVATPVAPPSVARHMQTEADQFVALQTPPEFVAVGQWYGDFSQTTDEEVRDLLAKSSHTVAAHAL